MDEIWEGMTLLRVYFFGMILNTDRLNKSDKTNQTETSELNCQKSNTYCNHTEDKKERSEGNKGRTNPRNL